MVKAKGGHGAQKAKLIAILGKAWTVPYPLGDNKH
jgi:hypothetical protein